MGFRRDSKRSHHWKGWSDANIEAIAVCMLPSDVVASERAWSYFLAHGYNRDGWWNKAPWFVTPEVIDNPAWRSFQALLTSYVHEFIEGSQQSLWFESLGRQFDVKFKSI